MRLKYFYLLFLLFIATFLKAQELVSVSTAASYNEQVFYKLSDDSQVNILNEDWDISFYLGGDGQPGIHVNESIRTSFGSPQNPVLVYNALTDDFSETIDVNNLGDPLQNPEHYWQEGALNSERDIDDPFDAGWGYYDDSSDTYIGNTVYALKTRDGVWYKFEVLSFTNGVYEVKVAAIDGSNESVFTVSNSDFEGHSLAYYNFTQNALLSTTPAAWDLFFARYVTDVQGAPFSVSGVLSNHDVQVSEAREIDPTVIDFEDFQDFLSDSINVIGNDWKAFDNGWVIEPNLSYFVVDQDNHCWQIWFEIFSGSSTGDIFFEKLDCGTLISVVNPKIISSYNIFPNPSKEGFVLALESKEAINGVEVTIYDMLGEEMMHKKIDLYKGLNSFSSVQFLSPGNYKIVLSDHGKTLLQESLIRQ